MGENVDVKALRAKFAQTQLEKAITGGGPSPRSSAIGHVSSSPNGVVRNKPSPVMPPRQILPMNSTGEPKRNVQPPHGVYPRPPPAHRMGAKEEHMTPLIQPEVPGRIKHTGELLQNRMLKHHGERTVHSSPRHPLPSQRSISEVAPLRKPLPAVGQRPSKPKRPSSVNLDHWRKKTASFQPPVQQQAISSKAPGRPPNKPTMLTQNKSSFSKKSVDHEEETYDDIDLPPPPPPPPKMFSRESGTDSFSSLAEDDSDQSEIYEHIDLDEPPPVSENKKPKDLKRQQELERKEQKEKLKKENENRKRFKLTGDVEVLHMARVREDWQGGKNDLRVRQGESIEIVRVKNNPEGKWLARNMNGDYGYISNRCVDVDYEEVKRKLLLNATPSSFSPQVHEDEEVYDDIGAESLNSFSMGGEVYDDVDAIPDEFPLPPPEICPDPKKSKKQEKEEKEFRKKFKFDGPIKVLCCMMVDPNANIKKGSGKDLPVSRGEILDVIQQTNEKRVLCRNLQGKYGYVLRSYLLQDESEIYDDIDNRTDIYDNDASTSGHFRS
ncbi:FYN-binding protein 1 isoform X1 [Astyanax mexicanus]|uniref:FYN-binding protein-like n=1 Tax=Astyanax mexicanus TaxID=7994 RepID=W5LBU0_ASTMX|nr:FYN-binding protein 1 isoform X1 [Astyanax mexicanus]